MFLKSASAGGHWCCVRAGHRGRRGKHEDSLASGSLKPCGTFVCCLPGHLPPLLFLTLPAFRQVGRGIFLENSGCEEESESENRAGLTLSHVSSALCTCGTEKPSQATCHKGCEFKVSRSAVAPNLILAM